MPLQLMQTSLILGADGVMVQTIHQDSTSQQTTVCVMPICTSVAAAAAATLVAQTQQGTVRTGVSSNTLLLIFMLKLLLPQPTSANLGC
jgi:hypothetical protein